MTQPNTLIESLSTSLFWDVDRAAVSPRDHADFLIRRVMERGNRENVTAVWNHYSEDQIREALVTAPSLTRKTISFFAHQFSLRLDEFRAHREASPHWVQ
jgi:hypothetical protein